MEFLSGYETTAVAMTTEAPSQTMEQLRCFSVIATDEPLWQCSMYCICDDRQRWVEGLVLKTHYSHSCESKQQTDFFSWES